jgi:hypothetical protein
METFALSRTLWTKWTFILWPIVLLHVKRLKTSALQSTVHFFIKRVNEEMLRFILSPQHQLTWLVVQQVKRLPMLKVHRWDCLHRKFLYDKVANGNRTTFRQSIVIIQTEIIFLLCHLNQRLVEHLSGLHLTLQMTAYFPNLFTARTLDRRLQIFI